MHIGLTYDLRMDAAAAAQAEYDAPQTIEAIAQAVTAAGHTVARLGSAAAVVQRLATGQLHACDLVFNIAEGGRGRCRESWVPALLETADVPYTGSGPAALALALDKLATKRLCQAQGIPTPRWWHVAPGDALPPAADLRWPCLVKPRHEGSAMGIDAGAVVRDARALEARVRWALQTYREPALVEEFIEGGEATVALIGNEPPEALPVVLRPLDPQTGLAWHVADTPGRDPATAVVPLALTPALEVQMQRYAVELFLLLGCRDVARVDFRIDRQGRPWVLEINPLPNLAPEDTFGLLGECLGIGYAGIIRRILEAAAQRLHRSADRSPLRS